MKNDRELLKLAAKAAGIEIYEVLITNVVVCYNLDPTKRRTQWIHWSPLTNDGDALRLAVKLKLRPWVGDIWVEVDTQYEWSVTEKIEAHNGDPYAATRRAIVRAAAAIGESMK